MVGAGGGAGASLTGEEVAGAVLEGEVAVAFFFIFSGAGGTRGSDRPASSEPTPMLLAPVSS
jgi:hypothetical protein